MRQEQVDLRVVGAVRFLDATTKVPVQTLLQVESDVASLYRNRSGLYILRSAIGLEAHNDSFEQPPATPAIGSVSVALTVSDPQGEYMDRRCTLALPRDPNPGHASRANSLFLPVDFGLYPTPAAAISPGWATIRASVTKSGDNSPLSGALVLVTRTSDSVLLANGLSDSRGEALVAVAGIPVITFDSGSGPVIAKATDVSVQAVFDPGGGDVPDPDALEANRAHLPSGVANASLTSGGVLVVNLSIAVP
jgi:hypothetical protein